MNARVTDISAQRAWVVFSGQCELAWLRILRPGFRHCYVLLHDGDHWITFDPLSNYTDINVYRYPPSFNLPDWMRAQGYTVVKTPLCRAKKQAPWMPFTCVEAVKRVIGLHARAVLTPWQLYKHLMKPHNRKGETLWEV